MGETVRDEIIAAVKAAGVVGAGGAGFPTHAKINASVDTVLVNGAECEPLLRANQLMMATDAKTLLLGLRAVMVATGAKRGIVCLKPKHAEAVRALEQAIGEMKDPSLSIGRLPDIYPAGDEQVLVHEITGKIVPEGGIPLAVGVVVANVETLINVAKALEGKPVIAKTITVGGAVSNPVTVTVPIGVSVAEVIALAGRPTVADYVIIDGGPMMGRLIEPSAPVTKTTGGLLVLPADHLLVRQRQLPWQQTSNRAKAVCCNCRACTDVCPRHLLGHGLEPHRIMQALGHGNSADSALLQRAMLCSECGACEAIGCSMGLSPRMVNAHLKREFGKLKVKNPYRQAPAAVRQERPYRLIPTKRLVARLGLSQYDVKAPLSVATVKPREVKLLLSQHIGAPSKPVVKVGDTVKRGDLVAVIPEGALGANLHASIAGQVTCVDGAVGIRALS